MCRQLILAFLLPILVGAGPAEPTAPKDTETPAVEVLRVADAGDDPYPDGVQRLDYRSGLDRAEDWALLWEPREPKPDVAAGGKDATRTWAVYLHGHGSGGEQLFTRPDVRDNTLAAVRRQGWGALAPNLRGNAWMGPAAVDDLRGLLRVLRERYGAEQVVLIGASMGGSGVLAYAAVYPEDADAVIALCPATDVGAFHGWCRERRGQGPPVLQELADAIEHAYGGPPAERAEVYAGHSAVGGAARLTMPVFVSHGSADEIIPVEQPRRLAEVLEDRPTFKYHELPGGDHEAPLSDVAEAMAFILPQLEEAASLDPNAPAR
jgi:pimeloyl-ACP methyl ester carboxylesterase